MAVVDIIIIAILILGAIIGFAKGLIRSLFGFIATIAALAAAYFLANPFINLLQNTFHWDVTGMVNGWFVNLFSGKGDFWTLPAANLQEFEAALSQSKGSLGILGTLFTGVFSSVSEAASGLDFSGGVTVVSQVAPKFGAPVLMILAVIVLFILLRILLFIIEKILDRFLKFRPLRTVDRLLGIVIGVVEAALLLLIVCSVLMFAMSLVEDPDNNVVMKYLMDSRIFTWVWYAAWNPIPGWLSGIHLFS